MATPQSIEQTPTPLGSPISNLPPEILIHIFTFLTHPPSLISVALTCRSFHQHIFDLSTDKYIWKEAARSVCGFGGVVEKWHDPDADDAHYLQTVSGGIPETQDDLWATSIGPAVVDIKKWSTKPVTLKGKERATGMGIEEEENVQMNLKPLYRDLCKAQMKWEKYFVSTKSRHKRDEGKAIDQESISIPRVSVLSPPESLTTHIETTSAQTEEPVRQISRRSARIAVKQVAAAAAAAAKEAKPAIAPKRSGKRKLIDSSWDGSTPKKARLPRYNKVYTSLPPLTTLPASLATTHYTKRLFSIVHTETEGARCEIGPPVVSIKIPSWGEQLDSYPLGKKDIPIIVPASGLEGMGETKMQKWERDMAHGGVRGNMAFFFFSDDPRMLWGDTVMNENSRNTVRRGVIGDFGAAPTGGHTVVDTDNAKASRKAGKMEEKRLSVQKDGDGDTVMTNGNGCTSLSSPSPQGDTALTNHGVSIERTRSQIYELTGKIQNLSSEKYYALYGMEQLPANDEPWLHQGQSYSAATVEFVRPTAYSTSFPSFKRLDSKRTLKSSISEHFPALKSLLGIDDRKCSPNGAVAQSTSTGDLGLNFQRLQKLGLSNPQMRRWAQNNIHSDANLKLVPQLRKKKRATVPLPETIEGAHEPETAGIEVAFVERLAVDYDNEEEQLEMKTKVNLRWKMPASQDLLSLNPPFEPPPMPTWPPASTNSSTGAPDATASSSTVHAFTSSSASFPIFPPFSPPQTPYPHTHYSVPYHFPQALSNFGTITSTDSANQHTGVGSTWEFRSRGPYVVSCDDNDGSSPSTMTCFRASHEGGNGEMGDMLWQRLLVVPLHYKDARLSVSAEVRTKEQVESLMHEFYYMDNDGFQLTSSMVIYATRRHIISPQLLAQHKREMTQEIIAEFHAQSLAGLDRSAVARAMQKKMALLQDKAKRDRWGIGCSSGYKACCEFWMFGLENGHTIKIVSLKEEAREVVDRWRGWVDWDVSDAGGLVASVGGARDVKWREVVRRVNKLGEKREMDGVAKPTASSDKGKKREKDKDKDKGKGKGKEKEKGKGKARMKTRSQARKVKQNSGNGNDSDGEGWTTDDGPESYLLGNQAYYNRCHCPACSPDFEDPMLQGYYSDYDDEFTSDDEFPLDSRQAGRDPQYHHRYLFCWNFKAHPITPSTKTPTNPGLHVLPLPSKAWWNSDDYHVFVSFSPCSRYIAASSNFRFALWDLEKRPGLLDTTGNGDGKYSDHRLTQQDLWCARRPEMWKVPRTDLHRWRKGGLFDTWHDREYFATQAEDQDDLECQPFNGIWILWEDVAVPRQPPVNATDLQSLQLIILEKGVSFINSIDLRRYVDGVNVQADVVQRMEEYHLTLEEMLQERAIELEEYMDEDWLDDPYDHDHFGLGLYPGLGFGMGGYYAGMDDWDDGDEFDHDVQE